MFDGVGCCETTRCSSDQPASPTISPLEEEGHLWASGPFIEDGVLVGDGLTILSMPTIEEAERVMKDEPLIKRGLRKFELRKWELLEGE
jgi:uncharacterized protein YciI